MKILVDEMPKSGKECIFRTHYSPKFNHWNCGFNEATVCSLDCGNRCKYLKEHNARIAKNMVFKK